MFISSDFFINCCILLAMNITINEVNIIVFGCFLSEIRTYFIINIINYMKGIGSG